MKNICFITLLFLMQYQVYSQKSFSGAYNYKATYELTYQPDSTNAQALKKESMFLFVGPQGSRFSSAGKAMKDLLFRNRNRENKSMAEFSRIQSQIPHTSLHYTIYKHFPSSEMSYVEKIATDNFRYSQDLDLFRWETKDERREISGFQAQKATTTFAGRAYTAWFTSEIPIPDGPYKFNGLPGLILEISDNREHYVFKLLQFEKLEEPMTFEFKANDFISTNQRKFLQVKKEYDQDPIAAVERAGIKFGFEPGQRERMHKEHLEELRKKNNPIELK